MKNTHEIFWRDKELKEFQKKISDIIQDQRKKGEQADFDREINVHELTSTDMGMYRHIQELEEKGFDMDTPAKLKKEMAFIRRYKDEVRVSKNDSRDIFMQWAVNKTNAILMRVEDALERLPAFKKKMKKIVRDELRKKQLKKDYDQSFSDLLDVDELVPSDMRIYDWIQSLKNMSSEKVASVTQEDFENYRAHYFQYFNQVPKTNKSRRTFVHYVGGLVTAVLSELELRTMYPEDFQKM